ncbi:MAG: orotate phosphoribosyltransferase [Bacteroidetes bacterium]|nr:MAG: orotate phosphoribosyltransferase [Bacteroidota bacterium]PIE88031.1 MAG: orotate phosphoribosyltransferase [Bacteroidota bacterium]
MVFNNEVATRVAGSLLQIKAIKLDSVNPFTWASGIKSPIYCDNRKTLSHPQIRTHIRQNLVKIIQEMYGDVDVIAGVATGAIAQGALVAQEMGLPFIYVRSSNKEHGLGNKIEGAWQSGQSVVVIEDLVSTGGSSLRAIEALREAGMYVKGMAAIFTYGLDVAKKNFTEANCKLYTLTDYPAVIEKAIAEDYIKKEELDTLLEWRKDPSNWKK